MLKPVIFIDMANAIHEIDKTVRISDITNPKRPNMLDIEIMFGDTCECGSVRTIRDANRRSGLFVVELVDQPKSWFAPAHCIIYNALQQLFEGYMAIEYVANQVGVYRFHVVIGNGQMIDSKLFQTPSTEGFESTLTGIETNGQVYADRQALKAEQFRDELSKLSSQIDTLDSVKERLPAVYDTDYRSGIAIGYVYGDLHFYVNLVDGEIDQAAVLCTNRGEAVGIFFYENIFVTKQQMMKQSPINLSMVDPVGFSKMLENYSDTADAAGLIAPHRRSVRNRDRGNRPQEGARRDRGGRGR